MSRTCCCVEGCKASAYKFPGLKLYRFPSYPWEQERRKQWIDAVGAGRIGADGKAWQPKKLSYVCNKHFVSGLRSQHPHNVDYVPTIFPVVTNERNKRKRNASVKMKENMETPEISSFRDTKLTVITSSDDNKLDEYLNDKITSKRKRNTSVKMKENTETQEISSFHDTKVTVITSSDDNELDECSYVSDKLRGRRKLRNMLPNVREIATDPMCPWNPEYLFKNEPFQDASTQADSDYEPDMLFLMCDREGTNIGCQAEVPLRKFFRRCQMVDQATSTDDVTFFPNIQNVRRFPNVVKFRKI